MGEPLVIRFDEGTMAKRERSGFALDQIWVCVCGPLMAWNGSVTDQVTARLTSRRAEWRGSLSERK